MQPILVGEQRIGIHAVLEHRRAEHAGVDDRLARSVGPHRIHDVGGIPDESHSPIDPPLGGVAVHHRVLPHLVGAADQRRDIEPVEVPLEELPEEHGRVDFLIPTGGIPTSGGVEREFRDPVLALESGRLINRADRVVDEPLLEIPDERERGSCADRWAVRGSPPEHGSAPSRVAFLGEALPARR